MSDERSGRRGPPEPSMAELAEMAVRRLVTAIVIAGGLIALGLYSQDTAPPNYQIVSAPDGRIYRVNTDSGSIVGCERETCALIQRGSDDLADKLPERPAVSVQPPQAQPALPAPARPGDNAAAPAEPARR